MEFTARKFNIEYLAALKSNRKNEIKLWLASPRNSTYQKIEDFKISEKPKFSYRDKNGNKIYHFSFKNANNLKFEIRIKTMLKNSKLKLTNRVGNPPRLNRSLTKFTKSEKFLEQTDAIKNLAKRITEKEKNILDKIIAINEFLKRNFKYIYPVKRRGVKNLNLKKLKGDCGEAGALFVTMCRILKIPAINKTGYVIYYNELNHIYEHGWTSVYLNTIGWIDIDPLAKNIKKIKNKYIYEQKNYLLSVVNGFNVDIKPTIPKNHKINYWRKLGLPMTKKSTQILQPLIFSSSTRTTLEEKIKIIK